VLSSRPDVAAAPTTLPTTSKRRVPRRNLQVICAGVIFIFRLMYFRIERDLPDEGVVQNRSLVNGYARWGI
jgi:hypothetical protein